MFYQIFKDHMIDGETLPLLSEEHLLDTLGLKLGPALKIRSQVHKLNHSQNENDKWSFNEKKGWNKILTLNVYFVKKSSVNSLCYINKHL